MPQPLLQPLLLALQVLCMQAGALTCKLYAPAFAGMAVQQLVRVFTGNHPWEPPLLGATTGCNTKHIGIKGVPALAPYREEYIEVSALIQQEGDGDKWHSNCCELRAGDAAGRWVVVLKWPSSWTGALVQLDAVSGIIKLTVCTRKYTSANALPEYAELPKWMPKVCALSVGSTACTGLPASYLPLASSNCLLACDFHLTLAIACRWRWFCMRMTSASVRSRVQGVGRACGWGRDTQPSQSS